MVCHTSNPDQLAQQGDTDVVSILLHMWMQDSDRLQQMGQERSSLQRQMRQVQERISLASSQQQVEEAASSLTTLENLLQVCCCCVAVVLLYHLSLTGMVRPLIYSGLLSSVSLLCCIVPTQVQAANHTDFCCIAMALPRQA